MLKNLNALEKKIITEYKNKNTNNKDFLKEHYKHFLKLLNPIVFKGQIVMNEFQYNLMMHLFTLCSQIRYVPSCFIKQIAEMSSFTTIELVGFPLPIKTQKSTEFLSQYYKIVSIITNNTYIKSNKKKIFEKIVSQKLNEKTVQWLINLFTHPSNELDDKTKILLKAITQTKFEFFEAFAENFKKTLYELINSSNKNKNWINKYVFKIIEKCLIKLPNIEKEFLVNLSKVCHSIIDVFVSKQNSKIKKLYRLSMRLMYIIYDKRNEKNSKIIKFLQLKFMPLINIGLRDDLVIEILNDFIEVNFYILNKRNDLFEYYQFFYSLILEGKKEENEIIYMKCIEKIFKYEMELRAYQISDIAFIRTILRDFTSKELLHNKIAINIICLIIQNCPIEMKLKILEEISFSNFSFFSEEVNIPFLEKLINAIAPNVTNEKIYQFYVKYLDLLFTHSINGKYDSLSFLTQLETLKYNEESIFYLVLNFANKLFLFYQESGYFMASSSSNDNDKVVIKILEILARKSAFVKQFDKKNYQFLLNVLAYFLIYKIIFYPHIELNSKFKINTLFNQDEFQFVFFLLLFTKNLPEFIFNKNTFLTTPIKIEISPLLLAKVSETKKIRPSEFVDFGESSEMNIVTKLYLLCIYTQFISKFFFLNILFDENGVKANEDLFLKQKILKDSLTNEKISILSLLNYTTDNIFLCNSKNNDFFNKMFDKFFEKYFAIIKKSYNTLFKQKLLSNDLKQLLNFACYFHSSIRAKSIRLIKTYAKYFPFILNEYEIFEYCVNVLGTLICYSVKHYDFFISEIPLNNFTPLQLPSEKKTLQQIYFELYKIFEKCLQKSHMINNNNITYNISNYMNQYIIDNSLNQSQNEGMNYSVNLLQKIYNNIKKIEIPPMLKTSAYLDPEKFQNYLKTHVKKNFDKYTSLSSLNDIYSPSDYAKSTKLQLRNKYIGIIEGKINNLKTEFSNNDDKCYYKFKAETSKKIKKIFSEEKDINIITKKVSPILIELTAFIVYSNMDNKNLNPLFKKEIINDELINILTSVPLLLNTANIIETATFCWEWILYLDKSKISLILNNIATLLKNNKNTNKSINQKKKSDIFDLENTLEDSIANSKEEYEQICENLHKEGNANCSYNQVNNFGKIIELLIISPNKNEKNRYISYDDFINGQIILLKFLKECMNEFCKCDMEKLKLIYDIIKNFVDLKISDNMYNCPLYIYLHFFVLNISLELLEIMQTRINLFTFVGDELNEFKILLFLYGLRYFKFDKQRRIIKSRFHLSEIEQTLKNCKEILTSEHKNKKSLIKYDRQLQHRKSNLEKVYKFVNLLNSIPNINEKETLNLFENHKDLLIFLIDNEMSSLRYWNNPSTSHKNTRDFSEDKIKRIFDSIFKFSNKLCLKLIQRFPWINNKFPVYVNKFGEYIYNNKSKFYHQPLALKVLIDYIVSNNKKDLEDINIMKSLIFWKFPSLNYALKFISLNYTGMIGLHKYCVHMMNHAMTTAIIFYLPQLINSLRTNTNFQVEKFILKKSKRSAKIAHQFLWALEVEEVMAPKTNKRYLPKGYVEVLPSNVISQILKVKILKNFNVMQRKFWYDENDIFGKICEVSGCFLHIEGEYSHLNLKMTKQEKTEFVRNELAKIPGKIQPYIYLPTNPNYKILDILPQTAVTLQSAKKVPFIMGFDAMEYPGPDKEALINNMDITSFIENEYSNSTNKSFEGMTHMYAQSSICRKENNNINAENCSSVKQNYFSIEKNANSLTKSKENLTISDVILEEDNDVTERIIENEKNQGIFVPTFDARILHNKYDFVPNQEEEEMISNEIIENNSNIETKLNNDININNKSVNVLSVIKENVNEEEKTSLRENTKKEKKNPFDLVSDFEEQKNINLLDNCTLSDIDLSDCEEGKYQSKTANQDEQSLSKDNKAFKKKSQIINMSCIFKVGDDLRQDSLALQVIQIFQEIFKENNLNLYTYPYQTISTISPKYKDLGGFIEVVKDCDSRDQIGKTYDTNLYDYYICSFGQENSKDFRTARKNLIESLAAYGIISYILQIKDRHNGNILIDKYGHLIHIDFGFIFDISPGGNMKFERAAFKLTKEMLKIMEGTESEAYSTFVDLTVRAFLACRDYMDKLLDPVVLMFSSGLDCFRDNSIQNFIDRFKLELNEEEAAGYMRELIKTAEDNWRTNVYDFIQKKQNNISY